LYVNEGGSPFVDTIGDYNVKIISTVSNLIDTVNLGQSAATEVWNAQLEGLYTAKQIMRLKDTLNNFWNWGNIGAANVTGFSARPAGIRGYYGNYYGFTFHILKICCEITKMLY
jgi:hypothetical protein